MLKSAQKFMPKGQKVLLVANLELWQKKGLKSLL
jgi:hypothetical protein